MTAFTTADILLPKLSADEMTRWSVVACDQYTSEPEYWKKTREIVGSAPSTLDLILPEAYLDEPDCGSRIAEIHENMAKYIKSDLFNVYKDCFILTKRTQADWRVRVGLVGAIDLEMYDYHAGSRSQVRATEATVAARIPPRVKIRMNAPLELPHIMILIDDVNNTVIEPLLEKKLQTVYDFELMQNGGHLEGAVVDGENANGVLAALDKLAEEELKIRHWSGLDKDGILLYAMGDGNHSLATAKECYEQKKRANSPDAELARYALVEVVNLHSPALEFEAIHRVITDVDPDDLLCKMTEALGKSEDAEQRFTVIIGDTSREFGIAKSTANLTVGSLQTFLDGYLSENGGKIDYIHGEDLVRRLALQDRSVGFLLPAMEKSELFPTVIKDGALPRKTFSMGHAHDKRFYCEARIIRK
ncbi:MAG: DUF1015 domain-containing protein [Oscillospiraceae bacterium]|nr:DUF1015 domain-containing protein [Oscillospiraceae bacterium]